MHYTLLLAITLTVAIINGSQPLLAHYSGPVYVHNTTIHNGNQQSLENQANFIQQTHLVTSIHSMQQFIQSARDNTREYTYGLLSWMNQNRIKTALTGALIGYGYVWYKLVSLNYALGQNTNWSTWHDTLTLEELLARAQHDLARDLLTAIQRHYTTPEKLDDIIGPLISFVRDVDTEILQLHQIVNVHTWIDRLRISFLFPKQSLLVSQAQDKIHRLTYLKNLLLNWVSEHKVARLTTR